MNQMFPIHTYSFFAVGHILKDKASKTSLGITVDKKMTTYVFEDFKVRCRLTANGTSRYLDTRLLP